MYPTLFTTPGLKVFADELDAERGRQLARFGDQHHPDGTGPRTASWGQLVHADEAAAEARNRCQRAAERGELTWRHVLNEEVAEAFAESDPAKLRAELIQIAAVCAAWVSALDRRPAEDTAASAPSARRTPDCGTNLAYKRHLRLREPTDPACRAAHARADRASRGGGAPVQPMAADSTHWTADQRRAAVTVAAHVRVGEIRDMLALLGLLPPEEL
ncbi:hypothetical protein [Streptomyces erythrochromogenes]|uniref:hypothetical protein n=1 Tax=Streptomyces erythrochromogenes TaxID=285574 RepID=UPI003688FF9A